jgi:hypothetical protein
VKTARAAFAFVPGLIALAMLLFSANALMADTSSTRLAVIPFSAPQKNEVLQQAASQLPDLLMVELSHENYFQLVEREKVSAIWSELHRCTAVPAAITSFGRHPSSGHLIRRGDSDAESVHA